MSTISSCTMTNPYGKTDECAQFIIDDLSTVFTLNDIMVVGQDYTFSFWVKSETSGNSILVGDDSFITTTEWVKWSSTFVASAIDLHMAFGMVGTYYIYHPQLEIGTLATDWTPSPEDVDESISGAAESASNAQSTADSATERVSETEATLQLLGDSIAMLVTDENGESLMTQTEHGWTFATTQIQGQLNATSALLDELAEKLGSTEAVIEALSNSVDEFGVIAEYVKIGSYTYTDESGVEQTEPSIDLFETDTGYKLKITNTRFVFTDDATELVVIDSRTNRVIAPNITIKRELQISSEESTGGIWVQKQRSNGHWTVTWKGVSS